MPPVRPLTCASRAARRRGRRPGAPLALACLVALGACASTESRDSNTAEPAGTAGTTAGDANATTPPPPVTAGGGGTAGCKPVANDVGVGLACTQRGGQCAMTRAGLCSADLPDSDAAFCSRICVAQDCGKDAACVNIGVGAAAAAFCVPLACVPAGTSTTAAPVANPCLTASGNSKQVGKLCTFQGGECPRTAGAATTCMADVVPGTPLPFCTMTCARDSDCGSGGRCENSIQDVPPFCLLATCTAE